MSRFAWYRLSYRAALQRFNSASAASCIAFADRQLGERPDHRMALEHLLRQLSARGGCSGNPQKERHPPPAHSRHSLQPSASRSFRGLASANEAEAACLLAATPNAISLANPVRGGSALLRRRRPPLPQALAAARLPLPPGDDAGCFCC